MTPINAETTWGYHNPKDYGPEASYIWAHDIANAASILLSPLVGIIRAIVALYLLHEIQQKINEAHPLELSDLYAFRRFYCMELGRAVLEILCLGIILGTVVDGIMTRA